MNAQAIAQVANFLNVSPNQIKRCEEWATVLFVQVYGCRPRFVSKRILTMFVKVECYKEQVVIDTEKQVGYVVRPGYDLGEFYLIKRFNPKGKDVRGLDYSSVVGGERLPDDPTNPARSAEYLAVMDALKSNKSLVAYGAPGDCIYPKGYEVR